MEKVKNMSENVSDLVNIYMSYTMRHTPYIKT